MKNTKMNVAKSLLLIALLCPFALADGDQGLRVKPLRRVIKAAEAVQVKATRAAAAVQAKATRAVAVSRPAKKDLSWTGFSTRSTRTSIRWGRESGLANFFVGDDLRILDLLGLQAAGR
jgi:hypothetical protein